MPHFQNFVRRVHIGENYISLCALEIRPMILENSILLRGQTLGMSLTPDIRCETARYSISCIDAALPPQEALIDMPLFHDSYMRTVVVSIMERNGSCILCTEPLTNDRPTEFKDPNVTVRYICIQGMLVDKK
jgi:hypothetical protein